MASSTSQYRVIDRCIVWLQVLARQARWRDDHSRERENAISRPKGYACAGSITRRSSFGEPKVHVYACSTAQDGDVLMSINHQSAHIPCSRFGIALRFLSASSQSSVAKHKSVLAWFLYPNDMLIKRSSICWRRKQHISQCWNSWATCRIERKHLEIQNRTTLTGLPTLPGGQKLVRERLRKQQRGGED